MRAVLLGVFMVGASLTATSVSAQTPMTPVRPQSSSGAASQWIEPPPAMEPVAKGPASAPAPNQTVAASEPDRPSDQAREARPSRPPSRSSGGSMASRLNRQELARIRSGGGGSYYRGSGGYSLWPFRF